MSFFSSSGDLYTDFSTLKDHSQRLGCPYIIYGCLTGNISIPGREQAVLLQLPPKWPERYYSCGYLDIDPIAKIPLKSTRAFIWSELEGLNKAQISFFEDAKSYGLKDGLSVPLFGPEGAVFTISFITDSDALEFPVSDLVQLAGAFHALALEQFEADLLRTRVENPMSEKMMHCVELLAQGYNMKQGAESLGMSGRTFVNRIQAAKKKMDVKTNEQLIAVAISRGYLKI